MTISVTTLSGASRPSIHAAAQPRGAGVFLAGRRRDADDAGGGGRGRDRDDRPDARPAAAALAATAAAVAVTPTPVTAAPAATEIEALVPTTCPAAFSTSTT